MNSDEKARFAAMKALATVAGDDSHKMEERAIKGYIERLEIQLKDSRQENVKLANSVDDMQHDFGVIAFCGLNMSKNDKESFRSGYSIEALQTLDFERDKRITLEHELRTSQGELESVLEYVKAGHCATEDCSDVSVHSKVGIELFNRVRETVMLAMVNSYLSAEVKRILKVKG